MGLRQSSIFSGSAGGVASGEAGVDLQYQGIHLSSLSFVPGARIQRYLGVISLHFIKESWAIRTQTELGKFFHSYLSEIHALMRAHAASLGANALLCFSTTPEESTSRTSRHQVYHITCHTISWRVYLLTVCTSYVMPFLLMNLYPRPSILSPPVSDFVSPRTSLPRSITCSAPRATPWWWRISICSTALASQRPAIRQTDDSARCSSGALRAPSVQAVTSGGYATSVQGRTPLPPPCASGTRKAPQAPAAVSPSGLMGLTPSLLTSEARQPPPPSPHKVTQPVTPDRAPSPALPRGGYR